MDAEKTIIQSKNWVKWYRQNMKAASIDKLLECKTVLVTNNYFLAEQLCDLKRDYNIAYYSRKIEVSKAKDRFVSKESMSVNKADYKAIIETEDILRNENDLESVAFRLENLIRHFSYVSDDIMQRISVLKKEAVNQT